MWSARQISAASPGTQRAPSHITHAPDPAQRAVDGQRGVFGGYGSAEFLWYADARNACSVCRVGVIVCCVTGRWPMGWEALTQWGDNVARIERLAGGVANDVWTVRVNGQRAVGRCGGRSDADLAWETDLLTHLDRAGLTVPVPIPTTDGRRFADGVVVMTYVVGGPPATAADWRRTERQSVGPPSCFSH